MPLTNAEKQARSRQRKAERVARLERELRATSGLLDQMIHRHPDTYREIAPSEDGTCNFRPGVARLEMNAALGK